MSYSVNGQEIFEASALFPLFGAWTVNLRTETASLSGPVAIDLDGFALRGTVTRSGASADMQQVHVVGGAGGLSKLVTPRQFRASSFEYIARTLLADGGEALSSESDTALLSETPRCWTVTALKVSEAVGAIARQLGATWRVLPDGTVWIGRDSFPSMDVGEAELVAERLEEGLRVYGVERPSFVPGVTLDGRAVTQVQHHCSADRIRTEVWFQT
jgi:hypothetical protein